MEFPMDISLEAKTLAYWGASSALHGQETLPEYQKLNTGTALTLCGDHLQILGPHRPLAKRLAQMQASIIDGRPRKKKADQIAATVLKPVFKIAIRS